MKLQIYCLFLLGFYRVVLAAPEDPSTETKIFLDSVEDANDLKHVTVSEWFISPRELDQLPASNPLSEDAPVTLKQAIMIAREELQRSLKPSESWTLTSVEFDQINRGASGATIPYNGWLNQETGKWFYKVLFSIQRPDPVTKIFTYSFPIYVLMDGTMAQHRVRPQTKEEAKDEEKDFESFRKAMNGTEKKKKRLE